MANYLKWQIIILGSTANIRRWRIGWRVTNAQVVYLPKLHTVKIYLFAGLVRPRAAAQVKMYMHIIAGPNIVKQVCFGLYGLKF